MKLLDSGLFHHFKALEYGGICIEMAATLKYLLLL